MFKKMIAVCATVAMIGLPVGGASAGPPERVDAEEFFLFPDADERKSVWINIEAADFCGWALGGFQGAPPVVDPTLPATINPGGNGGAIVASIKATDVYVEVWMLDDQNPDGDLDGPCEDILGQLLDDGDPWAVGTTRLNARTNNLDFPFVDYPRGVSDGLGMTAHLETTDGGEEYRYQVTTHGNSKCECGVTNTSLRRL